MDPRDWAKELPSDAREVLDAGIRVDAPAGARDAVWHELAAKLPAAGAAAATSGGLTALSLLKTFGVGLSLGAALVSGVAVVGRVTEPPTTPATAALTPAPSPPTPPPTSTNEASTPQAAPLPTDPTPTPRRGDAPSVIASPTPAPDAIGNAPVLPPRGPSIATFTAEPSAPTVAAPPNSVLVESHRVAHARSLLQGGDAKGALAELDAIERMFPRGVLLQERDALRIEALLAAGERARARGEAERFLARYPRSPHAAAAKRALP